MDDLLESLYFNGSKLDDFLNNFEENRFFSQTWIIKILQKTVAPSDLIPFSFTFQQDEEQKRLDDARIRQVVREQTTFKARPNPFKKTDKTDKTDWTDKTHWTDKMWLQI